MLGQRLAPVQLLQRCHAGRIDGLYKRAGWHQPLAFLGVVPTDEVHDDPGQIRKFLEAQPYALLKGVDAGKWFNKDGLLYPGEIVMMQLEGTKETLEAMVELFKDGTQLYSRHKKGIGQAGGSAILYFQQQNSKHCGQCLRAQTQLVN